MVPHNVVFRREGDYWAVGRGDSLFRLKDSKGLRYIDELLRSPSVEIHAIDLVAGNNRPADAQAGTGRAPLRIADPGPSPADPSDAGEMLDAEAKAAYKRRLADLREDVEEAERFNDPERAARAREEIDAISQELARAVGLGGRDRRAGSTAERARVNVTRAIKSAVVKIFENDVALGRYLDATIKTGTFCSYAPLADEASLVKLAPAPAAPALDAGSPPLPRALPVDEGGAFVGRGEEIERLRRAWERSSAGDPSLALIEGDPGIGKTKLATRFALELHAGGATVLYGRCFEENIVPYQPFVEALRDHLSNASALELPSGLIPGAVALGRLVPELAERFPSSGEPIESQSEADRYLMFEAIGSLLVAASRRSPVLLILDDLHWADRPTCTLLKHLGRAVGRAPVLMLGTYRGPGRLGPFGETLGDLSREHHVDRLQLGGLSEPDVAAMVDALAARALPVGVKRSVCERTEGNPFFIEEILRSLPDLGGADGATGVDVVGALERTGIPENVKLMITKRMDRLGDPVRRLLAAASVIGREFDLRVVASLVEGAEEELLDALDEAVTARLVDESADLPGRYSFSHALVRETLYEGLTLNRRVLVHRRIGDILEELYGADVESHLGELAHHFFQAARADLTKAIHYSVRAADRAMSVLAYEDAATHYEQAVAALELAEEADQHYRCELLLRQGEAQLRAGDSSSGKATFLRAADLGRSIADPTMVARAALGLGSVWLEVPLGKSDDDLVALLEETVDTLGQQETRLRATAMARLAREIYYTGDPARVRSLADDAVAVARRTGDRLALGESLIAAYLVAVPDEPPERRLALCAELATLDDEAPGLGPASVASLWGRIFRVGELLGQGDIAAADVEIERFTQQAEQLRMPYFRWFPAQWKAMRALLDGRLEEGRELAFRALSIGHDSHGLAALQVAGVQLQVVLAAEGRLEELEAGAEYFADVNALPLMRCALAALYAERGRLEDARREFDVLAADDFAVIHRDLVFLPSMATLAEACARLSDRARASILYDKLLPFADRYTVAGLGSLFAGSVERPLAILADTMSRLDDAEAHFERALERNRRVGARLYTLVNQPDYARVLLRRGGRGDRERAVALIAEALSEGRELGVTYVRKMVRPLLREHRISRKELALLGARPERRSADEVASEVVDSARLAFTKRGRAALASLVRDAPDEQLERRFGSHRVQSLIFRSMARAFDPSAAPAFEGEITYEIVHAEPGPARRVDCWTLAISQGDAAAKAGPSPRPAVSIRLSVPEFARLLAGESDPGVAMFDGRIEVRGDMGVAARLDAMFRASATR